MKKEIGFLSFGHWRAIEGSQTRTAADALLQTIELPSPPRGAAGDVIACSYPHGEGG